MDRHARVGHLGRGAPITLCVFSFLYRDNPFYRWTLAFYVGIYSGIAVPSYLQAQIFAQLADAVKPLEPGWGAVSSGLVLLGFLSVLAYFYFSAPHTGIHGEFGARIGIWVPDGRLRRVVRLHGDGSRLAPHRPNALAPARLAP